MIIVATTAQAMEMTMRLIIVNLVSFRVHLATSYIRIAESSLELSLNSAKISYKNGLEVM